MLINIWAFTEIAELFQFIYSPPVIFLTNGLGGIAFPFHFHQVKILRVDGIVCSEQQNIINTTFWNTCL